MELISATLSALIFKGEFQEIKKIKHCVINSLSQNNYYLPTCIETIDLLLTFLENNPKLLKLKKKLTQHLQEYNLSHINIDKINDVQINPRLRNYQVEDVQTLLNNDFVALFNDPRTGKTPTILEWCRLKKYQKVLVICPKSLQELVWKNEIIKWYNLPIYSPFKNDKPMNKTQRLELFNGFFSNNTKQGFLIVSKDTFKQDYLAIKYEEKFTCIIDEAHWLRNNQTNNRATLQSKAMNHIRKHLLSCAVLTGTPVVNHNSDLFGILRLLHPKRFDKYWQFVSYFWGLDDFNNPLKYFRDKDNNQGLTDLEVQFNNLVKPYYTRRIRKDVMKWLPAIEYKQVQLPMSANQKQQYHKILKEFRTVQHDSPKKLGLFIALRLAATISGGKKSNKIKWITEFVNDIEDNEQVIVFSSFSHKVLPFLEASLSENKIAYKTLIGDTKLMDRLEIVQQFQDKQFKVLLCNIQVAKEGLTLSNAAYAIFIDRSFNPADNSQAEARFLPTKIEECDDKIVIDILTIDSIDFKIKKLLDLKEDITSYIKNNGYESLFGDFD